jgi:co-chaperonin GroES (HSP10)
MSKKLVDSIGRELPSCSVPKVAGCTPIASQVVVEFLTAKEVIGTGLHVGAEAKLTSAPQGYVLAIGPKVDTATYGIKVGDRVIMSGGFTPLPEYCTGSNERQRGLVEPHCIKGVLLENGKQA